MVLVLITSSPFGFSTNHMNTMLYYRPILLMHPFTWNAGDLSNMVCCVPKSSELAHQHLVQPVALPFIQFAHVFLPQDNSATAPAISDNAVLLHELLLEALRSYFTRHANFHYLSDYSDVLAHSQLFHLLHGPLLVIYSLLY